MMISFMTPSFNRSTTNCKWGIWGFDISSLCLHSMTLDPKGFYALGIDT